MSPATKTPSTLVIQFASRGTGLVAGLSTGFLGAACPNDMGASIAPTGAAIEMALEGGRVAVTASARVDGPGGLFDFLPGVTVRSRAVAVLEGA